MSWAGTSKHGMTKYFLYLTCCTYKFHLILSINIIKLQNQITGFQNTGSSTFYLTTEVLQPMCMDENMFLSNGNSL